MGKIIMIMLTVFRYTIKILMTLSLAEYAVASSFENVFYTLSYKTADGKRVTEECERRGPDKWYKVVRENKKLKYSFYNNATDAHMKRLGVKPIKITAPQRVGYQKVNT